jgi:DNA-binding IscR family transcriptional regulator
MPQEWLLHMFISCNIICYMKRDSKLSGVLHILLHMAEVDDPVTSDTLAKAMHTNPVVIRRILAGLRKRGFVQSEKGHGGGWRLSCDLNTVTLRDIYVALGSPTMLAIGNRTESPNCLVEQAVNTVMNQAFRDAEALLLARFSEVTLAELSQQLHLHRQERMFCRGHDEAHRGRVRHGTTEQEPVQLTPKSDEQPDRSA